jgi:uncharacterized membrane protein (DUF485 family)
LIAELASWWIRFSAFVAFDLHFLAASVAENSVVRILVLAF